MRKNNRSSHRSSPPPSGTHHVKRKFSILTVITFASLSLAITRAYAVGQSQANNFLMQSDAQIVEQPDEISTKRVKAVVLSEPSDFFAQSATPDEAKLLIQLDEEDLSSSSLKFAQQEIDKSPGGIQNAGKVTQKSNVSKWMQERPYLLIILAIASVVGCCFLSQILLRISKQCNLSLNRYYIRKRFEKQKMMTNTIQQSRQIRQNQARQRRLNEERGQGIQAEGITTSGPISGPNSDPENQLELELEEPKDDKE